MDGLCTLRDHGSPEEADAGPKAQVLGLCLYLLVQSPSLEKSRRYVERTIESPLEEEDQGLVLQIINQMSNNTMGESPDFDECGLFRDEESEEAISEHEAEGTGAMEAGIIGVESEGLQLRVKPVDQVRLRAPNEEWAEEKLAELESQVRCLQLERDNLKSLLTDRD
jgi:hypothetical protein